MPEEIKKITRSRYKGLKDIYIAKVKQNEAAGYAADTPVKLARAISAKVNDKFTSEKIYSDDAVEDVVTSYEGTEVEIDVNALAPQDKEMIFSHMYKNGFLVRNKDDQPSELALGFRAKRLNGKYGFVWLYCGKFDQGFEENFETQQDKINTQTNSLKGTFYAREKDGNYQVEVDESNLLEEHTDAKSAIESWFSEVQEPVITPTAG